jgi:hypothetical protein
MIMPLRKMKSMTPCLDVNMLVLMKLSWECLLGEGVHGEREGERERERVNKLYINDRKGMMGSSETEDPRTG